jgi:pyrophosphatase PpaX
MPAPLLFDLDGTLVDSIELILASARHAFTGFGGTIPTDDEWRAGIGRPLLTMFREFTGDEVDAQRLAVRYREYQLEHHDRLLRPYEGVVELLRDLDRAGHPMALVTSKAGWLAKRALELAGVADLFSVLVGCDSCVNHKPHPEPVERALELLSVEPGQALFVGDSSHDVEAGRAAGVFTVGVTWGAFAREAMAAAGADALIDRVDELPGVIGRFSGGSVQTF